MLLHYFNKMGGVLLIKKLFYNHVFLYTVYMFLVLPKNRFGLEILAELIEKKIEEKLKRKYRRIITNANRILHTNRNTKVIWFCWLQGIENAPELVKSNLKRICYYFSDYTVKLITAENFGEFTELPSYIIQKYQNGIITHTHFSDILRTNLLIRNGGIWIDATVFTTGYLPPDIENSSFFLFRSQKPGSAGKCITVSSWFIACTQNHPIMLLVQDLLFAYWKHNNYLCDYFLFHLFVEIALEHYESFSSEMPKYSNEPAHLLLYELTNPFSKEKYDAIVPLSFVQKLTMKLSEHDKNKEDTFYKKLLDTEKKERL